MPGQWTAFEIEAVVAEYFEMFDLELRGMPYSKAEHNRALQRATERSRSSIEMKHQNISAVLLDLGYPCISGYKPLRNYQRALFVAVEERLRTEHELVRRIAMDADARPEAVRQPTLASDILGRIEPAPRRERGPKSFRERLQTPPSPSGIAFDYAEREARNAALGTAGELFVLEYERERLRSLGCDQLADRIEHVAATEGPAAGFDILSFERNGQDRLIEVKTTGGPREMAFFVSRHELATSRQRARSYHLYRPFNFRRDPHFFVVSGALSESCLLEAEQYRAVVA